MFLSIYKIAEEYQLKPEFFYSYHEFLQSEDILINNKSYVPEELASGDSIDFKIDFNPEVAGTFYVKYQKLTEF